jgi:hypothetical protein
MRLFSHFIAIVFVALLNCAFISCSIAEREFASAQSPDKKTRVSVRSLYVFPDYTVSFEVRNESFRKRVVMPEDRLPLRAEIYLGSDRVGILICDKIAPTVERNVDLTEGGDLPFEQVRSDLSSQIVRKYEPTDSELTKFDGDVLKWFCGDIDARRLPKL